MQPEKGKLYCDLTIGEGGHAYQILEKSSPDGKLIGFDRDGLVLEKARERLSVFSGERFILVKDRFSKIVNYMGDLGINGFDGILADFGVSSFQLEDESRGFSFKGNGILDMRMDVEQKTTALELIKELNEWELATILRNFGGEKSALKIAKEIKSRVRKGKLSTTSDLRNAVHDVLRRERTGKIDSSTRTFQALRIAVNDELNEIKALMNVVFNCLNKRGVFVCISYHSLEDEIVKKAFTAAGKGKIIEVMTKKPLFPTREEIAINRRARSARLRAALKI